MKISLIGEDDFLKKKSFSFSTWSNDFSSWLKTILCRCKPKSFLKPRQVMIWDSPDCHQCLLIDKLWSLAILAWTAAIFVLFRALKHNFTNSNHKTAKSNEILYLENDYFDNKCWHILPIQKPFAYKHFEKQKKSNRLAYKDIRSGLNPKTRYL